MVGSRGRQQAEMALLLKLEVVAVEKNPVAKCMLAIRSSLF